jgi:hypothetical protein
MPTPTGVQQHSEEGRITSNQWRIRIQLVDAATINIRGCMMGNVTEAAADGMVVMRRDEEGMQLMRLLLFVVVVVVVVLFLCSSSSSSLSLSSSSCL